MCWEVSLAESETPFYTSLFFRPDNPDAKENAGNNCMFQKCWSSSLIVSGCALMAAIAWLRLRVLLAMLLFRLEPLLPLASLYSCFKLTPWIATCDKLWQEIWGCLSTCFGIRNSTESHRRFSGLWIDGPLSLHFATAVHSILRWHSNPYPVRKCEKHTWSEAVLKRKR